MGDQGAPCICIIIFREERFKEIQAQCLGILRYFGLDRMPYFEPRKERVRTSARAERYRPPEILLGATDYRSAVDVWGAGSSSARKGRRSSLAHRLKMINWWTSDKDLDAFFGNFQKMVLDNCRISAKFRDIFSKRLWSRIISLISGVRFHLYNPFFIPCSLSG